VDRKADVRVARRTERLIVRELGDEVLVYDLDTDEVHRLSGDAARLYLAVGSESSTRTLSRETGIPHDVAMGLAAELDERNLLSKVQGGISRRQVLQRSAIVGGAVLALPAIESIIAPTAALALSNVPAPGYYDLETAVASFINSTSPSGNAAGNYAFYTTGVLKSSYSSADFTAAPYSALPALPAPGSPTLTVGAANSGSPGFANNSKWWYTLSATNGEGETTTATPVMASANNKSNITVNWTAAANATGYKIYRAPDSSGSPGAWSLVQTVTDGSTTSFVDPNVTGSSATLPGSNTALQGQFQGSGVSQGSATQSSPGFWITVAPTGSNAAVIAFPIPPAPVGTVSGATVKYTATNTGANSTRIQIVNGTGGVADTVTVAGGSTVSNHSFTVTPAFRGDTIYVVIGTPTAGTAPGALHLFLQVS